MRTNYTNANGEHPLVLVLQAKQESKKFNIAIYVSPKHWNKKTKKVLYQDPEYVNKNMIISNYITKANEFLFKAQVNNADFTFEDYKNFVLNIKPEVEKDVFSYYEFAEKYLAFKKDVFSHEHYRGCKSEITKLKKFKPNLLISEINYTFLQKYETYMRDKLSNKTNTVKKSFTRLKAFLNEAVRQNVISVNPFIKYPIVTEKTNRTFLEVSELKLLQAEYKKNTLDKKLQNVLHYFLLACFTGLRYTDMYNLKKENIKDDFIEVVMHKTKDYIRIPLTIHSKPLVEKEFRVYSNQKTNDYLKVIMLKVDINKDVSFHTARHTFATICITQGIPLEVVSKLLGHNELKTTMIYAKIIDSKKVSEMDKWNDL